MLARDALGCLQSPRYGRTVGDYRHIRAFPNDSRLAKWNHVLRTGIGSASERFAIETLMFEEEHGIIRADCGTQQTVGIESVRRKYHAHSRPMRKQTLSAV